jgi:hypothetical protein
MTMLPLWPWQLIGAMVGNGIVQCIAIGAFAARISGVYTKRIAISLSLFTLFATASRLATLFYTPLLGTISDSTANAVTSAIAHHEPGLADPALAQFEFQLRLIVLAGTVGMLVGAFLLPTFIMMFTRGIAAFERLESIPRALARLLDPRVMRDIVASIRIPDIASWRAYKLSYLPAKMLIFNTVLQAVYAIGVLAAVLASVREPYLARTATLLSGIVNGIGTLSFSLFVDPTSSAIVDQAVTGRRGIEDVRSMVFWLTVTAIGGTLVSQLLLYPAALLIGAVAHLVHR